MRRQLGNECRKAFRQMMRTHFPAYNEDRSLVQPPGTYMWSRQDASGIWFYISLVIHPTHDEFTVEAAWNFEHKNSKPIYDIKEDYIIRQPELFRPNHLWSGKDYWWCFVLRPQEYAKVILYKDDPIEQCLPLVAPAAEDAAVKLKKHLIPLFERVVQLHKPAHDA